MRSASVAIPGSVEIARFDEPLVDEAGALLADAEHVRATQENVEEALRIGAERELPVTTGDPELFAELQKRMRASEAHLKCREAVRREAEVQAKEDGWISYMTGLPPGLYGFRVVLSNEREVSRKRSRGASIEISPRRERIARINGVFRELYSKITADTPLDDVTRLLPEAIGDLVLDPSLARAVAFQALEMIGPGGAPKMRSAGMYYATHPLLVAAWANELATSFPEEERRSVLTAAVLHDVAEEGRRIAKPEDLTALLGVPPSIAVAPFLLDAPYALTAMPTAMFEDPGSGPWWFNGFKVWGAFQECLSRCPRVLQAVELADRLETMADPVPPPDEPERRASFVAWMLAKNEEMIDAIVEARPELEAALDSKARLVEEMKGDEAEPAWRFFRARVEGAKSLMRRVRRVHRAQIDRHYLPYSEYLSR